MLIAHSPRVWRAVVLLGAVGLCTTGALACGPSARPMGGDAAPDTRFPGLPDGLRWDGLRAPDTRAPDVPDVRAPDSGPPDPWASSSVTITYQRSVPLTFVTLKTTDPNLGDLTYVGDVLYATVVAADCDEVAKVNVQDGKVYSQFVYPAAIKPGLASDGTCLFLDRSSEYAKHQVNGSSAGTLPSELEGNGGGMEIAQNVLYQVGAGGKGGGVYGVDLASKQTSFIAVVDVTNGSVLATSPQTFIVGDLLRDELAPATLTLRVFSRSGALRSTTTIAQSMVPGLGDVSGMAWNGTELAVADHKASKIHFFAVH